MTRRIRVVVTAEDIERGARHNGDSCPMARAVQRSGFPDGHVGSYRWYPLYLNGLEQDYPMSKRAIGWVTRFDDGEPVQPATFYLDGPDR